MYSPIRYFYQFLSILVVVHGTILGSLLLETEGMRKEALLLFFRNHVLSPELTIVPFIFISMTIAMDSAKNSVDFLRFARLLICFLAMTYTATVGFIKAQAPSQISGHFAIDFLLILLAIALPSAALAYLLGRVFPSSLR